MNIAIVNLASLFFFFIFFFFLLLLLLLFGFARFTKRGPFVVCFGGFKQHFQALQVWHTSMSSLVLFIIALLEYERGTWLNSFGRCQCRRRRAGRQGVRKCQVSLLRTCWYRFGSHFKHIPGPCTSILAEIWASTEQRKSVMGLACICQDLFPKEALML